MSHSTPKSQVNKDGHYVFQPESYGYAFDPTQVQLPMPLQSHVQQGLIQPYQSLLQQQSISMQSPCRETRQQRPARVPQPPFTATVHAHAINNVAQPTTPLYAYPSANSSLAPSPVSPSGSEFSSPFDDECASYGMWDVDADVTSMKNDNVNLGVGMMDGVDVGSVGFDWQMMDESDRTMSDMLMDTLAPSTTPFKFASNSIVGAESAPLLSSAASEERRLMQLTATREEPGRQRLTPPPLAPSVTAPVSIATDGPPMMAPGSDASVFLFPGEQEPERPLDEEFLVQRSISSTAPTITQSCATIAPALLSSSSHATATMYVHAADIEMTPGPRNEAEQGPSLLAPLMSPDGTSTPEAETTVFSPESPAPTPDERSFDYAADWPSRSIFDVVKTDDRRTLQREALLPRQYPVVPVDILQRAIGRMQSAKKDERGRTKSMVCQNVVQPGLMDDTRSAATGGPNFAVVFPTIDSGKATKKAANLRQSESTNLSSGQTKKCLGKPSSPKFACANANTARPEYDGDSIFVASFPQKRKLSEPGLVELSEPGYEPVVNVNTAKTNGPDISVGMDRSGSRLSQQPSSFAIVIKEHGIENSDNKTESSRCQHNFHHPNKRQKIFAGLALAVGTLAVGIGATKAFA
ncbi:hypothetical protein POJ06DRAFT_78916 [Lipomyces tetrasporus]|uniref:Uncharacterized protein n=1 Tax=Lipomyces tetrasporus TaxID=54092 RepID=A0AAD7VUM4_9ASCO|nr:uncharacterized protein POJ06DRAFT_78916 [Lipomyces tetrasporus]KAJ8102176.1 hypothetical protein POJ06DRAFT_78916 [Lipomyces tetrasporus]